MHPRLTLLLVAMHPAQSESTMSLTSSPIPHTSDLTVRATLRCATSPTATFLAASRVRLFQIAAGFLDREPGIWAVLSDDIFRRCDPPVTDQTLVLLFVGCLLVRLTMMMVTLALYGFDKKQSSGSQGWSDGVMVPGTDEVFPKRPTCLEDLLEAPRIGLPPKLARAPVDDLLPERPAANRSRTNSRVDCWPSITNRHHARRSSCHAPRGRRPPPSLVQDGISPPPRFCCAPSPVRIPWNVQISLAHSPPIWNWASLNFLRGFQFRVITHLVMNLTT